MLLEGPATGHRGEGLCVILVVHRENAELVPIFKLQCMLFMLPYQYQRQSSDPVHSSHPYKNLKPTVYTPSPVRPQHISSAAYPGHSRSHHLNHFNFQGSNLSATYIYQKDERTLFGNLHLR